MDIFNSSLSGFGKTNSKIRNEIEKNVDFQKPVQTNNLLSQRCREGKIKFVKHEVNRVIESRNWKHRQQTKAKSILQYQNMAVSD